MGAQNTNRGRQRTKTNTTSMSDDSTLDSSFVEVNASRTVTRSSFTSANGGHKAKRRAKIHPKIVLYGMFLIVECVMVGIYFFQVSAVKGALWDNYRLTVSRDVAAVQFGYSFKMELLSNAILLRVRSSTLYNYMSTGTGYAAAYAELKSAQSVRSIDYVTLVSPNGTIVVGANNNRVGEAAFNPGNIVTLMAQNLAMGWVQKTVKVSYSEFMVVEGAPVKRFRATVLDAAMKDSHPADIKSGALIRFLVAPFYKNMVVTHNISDVIGYCICGDNINGQADLASRVSHEMGGYVGYYMKDSNNTLTAKTHQNWVAASHSASIIKTGLTEPLETLAYDPVNQKKEGYLTKMLNGRGGVVVSGKTVNGFLLAGSTLPLWPVSNGDELYTAPDALVVRGIDVHATDALSRSTSICLGFLAAILIVDCFSIFLATFLFLTPLEKMGRLVKAGASIDVRHLRSLTRRKNYIVFVALFNFVPLVLSVFLCSQISNLVHEAFTTHSKSEPGTVALLFKQKAETMLSTIAGVAAKSYVKSLASSSPTATAYNDSLAYFREQQASMASELVFMVNATSRKIILDVNTEARVGSEWDVAGLVTDVAARCFQYVRIATTTYDMLKMDNFTSLNQKLVATTPDSKLSPVTPGQQVLMRYAAVPVYSNATAGQCDAIIVAGYVTSGSTVVYEKANHYLEGGYSALYFFDGETYQLSSGVLNSGLVTQDVDVEIPDTGILDATRKAGYRSGEVHSQTMRIDGKKYIVSARCQTENTVVDTLGTWYDAQWAGAPVEGNECFVYLVRGMPLYSVANILNRAMRLQYVGLAVQAVKVIAMIFLCWKVYQPFQKIILRSNYGKDIAPAPAGSLPPKVDIVAELRERARLGASASTTGEVYKSDAAKTQDVCRGGVPSTASTQQAG